MFDETVLFAYDYISITYSSCILILDFNSVIFYSRSLIYPAYESLIDESESSFSSANLLDST
jgi:hypothetical protein